MRLIDADMVLETCNSFKGTNRMKDIGIKLVNEIVGSAPTVDAEPVIRCEDCKYFKFGNGCFLQSVDYDWEEQMGAEDFCSRGEKRDE